MTRFIPFFDERLTPAQQTERLALALQRLKTALLAHATLPLPPEAHWCFLLLPGRTEPSLLNALENAGGQILCTAGRKLTMVRFSPRNMPASTLCKALAGENDTAYLLVFATATSASTPQLCDWTDAVMTGNTQGHHLPDWALLAFDGGSLLEETN